MSSAPRRRSARTQLSTILVVLYAVSCITMINRGVFQGILKSESLVGTVEPVPIFENGEDKSLVLVLNDKDSGVSKIEKTQSKPAAKKNPRRRNDRFDRTIKIQKIIRAANTNSKRRNDRIGKRIHKIDKKRNIPKTERNNKTKSCDIVPINATASRPHGTICQYGNGTVFDFRTCRKKQSFAQSAINISNDQSSLRTKKQSSLSTLQACVEYSLPYDEYTPKKCQPRPVLLPSFPTTGNTLVKEMFHRLTNLVMFTTYCNEGGLLGLRLSAHGMEYDQVLHDWSYLSWGDFPSENRTALAKIHGVKAAIHSPAYARQLWGVVRLARNPGDNLLRNVARWSLEAGRKGRRSGTYTGTELARACHGAFRQKQNWVRFHNVWSDFERKYPSVKFLTMYYERFSDIERAGEAFNELLTFTGEASVVDVDRSVREYIRPLDYNHGSTFADYCGVESARKLHEYTKNESERLGYKFDYDTGRWYL